MSKKLVVQEQEISIIKDDYISLTDMVKNIENGLVLIEKWLRNKNTIEFLGIWGEIYNEAGAHKNIAFGFASWISPKFKLYLIKEFQRLKENVALFRFTAKEWSDRNPKLEGNMRDYATAEQPVVLANLENFNAQLIKQNISFEERLIKLNKVAIEQLKLLVNYSAKKLKK